jgi:hydrogenase/urease accessory protein HupE
VITSLVRLARVALALMATLMAPLAGAHELSMAELLVREVAHGEFVVQWGPGEKSMPGDSMTPQWPAPCQVDGLTLRCGEQGLMGTLGMKGVGDRFSAVLVKVHWFDGQTRVYTLTAGQPTVHLVGSADDRRGVGDVASAYMLLGVEHILTGFDHLLFVAGLLFLVGFQRRLIWTITAFTVAHSLTLASAALGWLTLRPPPVEACIALSIMLVASEALSPRETLARRWPAILAFVFGLVHGLGFAGALKEIGLPESHLSVALLTFNLGVEAGQLMAVGAAWALVTALQRAPGAARLKAPSLYAIGGLAAYWTCLRVSALGG